ncbi:protein translocase subunit SecD [mine drainage metagenome]|uniref:Protein translocase subunit SecD n=1 Tax=mine drainage metagenome TaxID=410659 RepID=A0A1J5QMF8_9ZZZZ
MPDRPSVLLVVCVAGATVLAGCGASDTTSAASGPSTLQFRLVTSSTAGPCHAPPLTSDAPGSACGESGTTTYQVGASLGQVTPTAVTYPGGTAATQVFSLELDQAGSVKLGDITSKAVGKQLAVLIDGRVFNAPTVGSPITGSSLRLATSTPAETAQVAAALHATATS